MANSTSSTAGKLRVTGVALLAAVALGGSVTACGSSSTSNDSPREITAVGTGDASGKPDVLTVELAVQHQAGDVTTALNDASASAQKVVDAAGANGVDKKDVATANVRVNPRYGTDRQITSYEATQSLTVKVRKLETASKLLGDLATAGGDATRISSVGFDIENDSALKATARDKAFAEAKSRAEQYAKLSGGKLGEVRTVTEGAAARPTTTRQFSAPDSAPGVAASPVPIESGEQSLTVTVTVVFALS
ncbi:SIMPL domain-containing protein [Tsukamurella tyrosinosolvens]|uniref:SIMPL domain-containing protein n=1 Tax=Tsukamurella tyrosinosolvens TaxID=57704 RepID=UPI002DD44187|nr:SIMPL domain-containing protein [Tsukamurella tyrosinosolvens]MEC4613719.1 SIMPL domain-containing protein [Tsukamurella tyrosinosolvens]